MKNRADEKKMESEKKREGQRMEIEKTEKEKDMELEKRLHGNGWKNIVHSIALPQQIKENIIEQTAAASQLPKRSFCVKLIPAAVCLLLILVTVSKTAYAVYENKHLNVFFEKDITAEQMDAIEAELKQLEGVVSCRYTDADTAWKNFAESYLTPELEKEFKENPLAESANIRVGVSMSADAEQIKARIEALDGVRHVSGLWEE